MKMLVLVINDEDLVDRILLKFSKIGVRGATVIDSVGMGGVLGVKIPFLKKLEGFVQIEKPDNKTIFTVINDDNILKTAVESVKAYLDFEKPGTGFMFVLPVLEVYGTSETSQLDT